MLGFLGKWSQQIWIALAWSLLTQVLLSLPGSVFPSHGLFSIPYLDKIAHFGLFSGLVFWWSLFFCYKKNPPGITWKVICSIALICFAYGFMMEFVQRNFIPNRSFEIDDMIADLVGTLIGYIVTHWY